MARRLRGKVFAPLAIIISGLIAFYSIGIPSYATFPEYYSSVRPRSGLLLENPRPLSFPIYGSLSLKATFSYAEQDLQLYFAGLLFHTERIQGAYSPVGAYWLDFSLADYAILFSFFMLINVVGFAFGYWLSRRAFIDRLSKPVKRVGPAPIAIALTATSVYFLFSAYQLWSGYNWAMQRLQVPIPVEDAFLFRQLIWAIGDYVSLFPVYFLVGLTFGTFALVIVARNSRRKALITAAIAIVSSTLLFFEAYKIWEIHHLATHQVLGPLAYLTYFHHEATYVYQTLFWLYLLSGSIAVASGIIIITLRRLKA